MPDRSRLKQRPQQQAAAAHKSKQPPEQKPSTSGLLAGDEAAAAAALAVQLDMPGIFSQIPGLAAHIPANLQSPQTPRKTGGGGVLTSAALAQRSFFSLYLANFYESINL